MNGKPFHYKYAAPSEEERAEIEDIRKRYLPESAERAKLERLKELNGRVQRPSKIVLIVGMIVGILLFGLGMSMVLEWSVYLGGVAVSVAGAAAAVLALFLSKRIYRRNENKYRDEILKLSEELLNERDSQE